MIKLSLHAASHYRNGSLAERFSLSERNPYVLCATPGPQDRPLVFLESAAFVMCPDKFITKLELTLDLHRGKAQWLAKQEVPELSHPASVNVVTAFREEHVIPSLFPKRWFESHVQFVGLARGSVSLGVISQRVARLDPLD